MEIEFSFFFSLSLFHSAAFPFNCLIDIVLGDPTVAAGDAALLIINSLTRPRVAVKAAAAAGRTGNTAPL